MASNPIPILVIAIITYSGMGLMYGSEIAERSFPSFEEPESSGFFGAIEGAGAAIQQVWGVVVFVFNFITFNVPGAEWWVRAPLTVIFGGSLTWSIATLIRGN